MTRAGRPLRPARGSAPGDAGAATLESVGAVVVAALLAGAVLVGATVVSPSLGEMLRYWVCRVTTLGQGGCAPPVTAEDRRPTEPCVISSDGSRLETSVGVVVVVDGEENWLVEHRGDGTYELTRALRGGASTGVGPSGGFSVVVDDQAYGGHVGASASASGYVEGGESYVVPDSATAEDFLSRTRHDDVQDAVWGEDSLVRDGVDWLTEQTGVAETELPEPDSTFVAAGARGEVRATATGLSTSASAGAGISGLVGTEIRRDGTYTVYAEAEASADASAGFTSVGGAGESYTAGAAGASSWELDYDADGSVVAVRLVGETSTQAAAERRDASGEEDVTGTPDASVTRTTLELETRTDADRAVVADMAAAAGMPYVPGLSDGPRRPGISDPAGAVDAAQAFAVATLDHGRVWEQRSTEEERTRLGATLEAGLVGEYGGGFASVVSSSETEGVRYFDGRGWTDMEGCGA